MTTPNLTKSIIVSALICAGSVFAEEVATPKVAEKATDTTQIIAAPATKEEAIAEVEAARRKIMEMKEPRDKHMAAVGELEKKVEARRKAILEENKDAAQLSVDIAKLDQELQAKAVALNAVFDADTELAALQVKVQEERENFGKTQLKMREEISKQHRERRLAMEKAKEAAAKAEEAAKADKATKESGDK